MATISEILKTKSDEDEEPKKKSREDWRKEKELEEARKVMKIIVMFIIVLWIIINIGTIGRNSSSGS